MEAGPQPFFVADSALYSAENVASLSEKLLWVTRVPATLSHVKQLVEETEFESTPEAQKKAEYGFYEVSASYGGVEQRGVVVFSPAAYQRERATLQKRRAQERARAEKQLWHLRNQTFADPQGAQDAGKRLEDTWAYHITAENLSKPHDEKSFPGFSRHTYSGHPYSSLYSTNCASSQTHSFPDSPITWP